MSTRVVAVVGGGITGLAAAWELTQSDDPPRVVVLEGSPTLGGKLRTATVGGQPIDVGAESVLARRREALQLLTEAGLGSAIVHPTSASATIWSRGRHWPLPLRTLMGVPSDPASARGLLTPAEVDRLAHEPALPPVSDDLSVGDFVEARVGPAVVDRLVEPLLASVYAGHARRLSLRATVPALWAAAVRGDGLVATAARVAAAATTDERAVTVPDERDLARTDRPAPPVFAGFRGGLGHAVVGLTDRLRQAGVDLRTGSTVRALARSATGWTVTVGPTTAPEQLQVDAVVLATPAPATARLLRDVHHAAAAELATIDYASIAIVSLALPRSMEPVVASIMRGSGFLVPPTEPVTIKAATFSASKWEWVNALDPEVVHLRTSVGRAGDTAVLQRDDAELVAVALGDLTRVVGAGLPAPVDTHVQRWGGALPQYAVGHVDRVARVLDGVGTLPGLEVAGAAYDGVGVPACIGSGRAAAGRVLAHLAHRAHLTHLTHRSGPDATLGG